MGITLFVGECTMGGSSIVYTLLYACMVENQDDG